MKYLIVSLLLISGLAFYYLLAGQAEAVDSVSVRYEAAELLPFESEVRVGERTVSEKTLLDSGDQVTTNNTGRALVKTGPQLITSIGENSTVIFSGANELAQTKFEVVTGRIWSRLERALEQDEVYEVYTPTLAAAVRGTAFGAEVGPSIDRIIVTEGIVEIKDRNGEAAEMVAAGNIVTLLEGKLVVTPLSGSDYDEWLNEHIDPDWEWGGSPLLTLITAHREGFWWDNAGLITVEGTGFNQAVKLEIDNKTISFVPVSDRVVQVPIYQLLNAREDSEAYIYLSNGDRVNASDLFTGSEAEVRQNLLW